MNPASTPVGSVAEINPIGRQRQEILTASSGGPPPKLPCGDLIGNRDDYHKICVPLFNASIRGDWGAVQVILDKHQDLDLLQFGITENYDTALHIAACAKSTKSAEKFAESLVDKMSKEQLELQNKNYNTALCIAAASGNFNIAKMMVEKNPALPQIPGSQGMMPLYMASLVGHEDMVHYLYDKSNQMTGDLWTDENRGSVFQKCVEADMYDFALKLVADRPELAVNGSVLRVLARNLYAFITPRSFIVRAIVKEPNDAVRLLRIIWKNILKLPKATIDDILRGPADVFIQEDGKQKATHSSQVLFIAAEIGNTEFLVELIREYPDLLWVTNDNNQTIFHVAVSHRRADIYNLLHEIGSMKDTITTMKDEEGNILLHLVGKNAKINRLHAVSGIQQMHHELLWFKEIRSATPYSYREWKNNHGQSPGELFKEEHKDMISVNEKLIKDTANQCMVAAALIASIAFAAAITVPGGYNQNNGIPMFVHNGYFTVFAISDAISLIFSSTSIFIFLSIFLSPYAAADFLELLPKKLMRGLITLFYSITAMLVCFSVSFFLLYQERMIWVPIIISILTFIPIILFVRLQYDLLGDVYNSTYGSKYLFKPKKHKQLYYQNPKF